MAQQTETLAAGTASTSEAPHLRRVLGLRDLIFYGIVLIQPVGGIGIFVLANKKSLGHVTATILLALVAMMLTALSYGRMAGLYPAAGSAYTYVGRGLNPHLGFLAGWAMFLDYLVIPLISIVFGALSMQRVMDALTPSLMHNILTAFHIQADDKRALFVFWVLAISVMTTFLNLRGIKWTARANVILTIIMFAVIGLFTIDSLMYIMGHGGLSRLFSLDSVYHPLPFKIQAVGAATSLAALTYIGFDGITTLSEEVKEPKRTVPVAVVLVCAIIGVCAALEVYLGHLVWPDYNTFADPETGFFDVCERVGGKLLFHSMALVMAIACLGSALTGQVGAARILFGMGRDNALPGCFARLDKHNNPALNILLIGVVAMMGALWLPYEKAANLINFGAFLAFLGVNAAVFREFVFRPPAGHKRNWLFDIAFPVIAFAFCLWMWASLDGLAKTVGGIWCGVGLAYTAWKTKFFTRQPVMLDLSGS
jgi:putrescine importer